MSTAPDRPRRHARIEVRGIKLSTMIPPAALPADLVAPDGQPAGEPVIDVVLDGGALVVSAQLSGKSVRRALKLIAENGVDNVNVLLQGNLRPPIVPGGAFILDAAGIAATPKAPKSE